VAGIPVYIVGGYQARKAERLKISLGLTPTFGAAGAPGGSFQVALRY
jgi:hypothetical protein